MQAKLFTNVVANLVIAVLVVSLAAVASVGATVGVFNRADNNPVYKGNRTDAVSLMVNVYWGTEYIDGFLEIFDKYDVKTTFFVGGCWAAKNPDVLAKIVGHGHEIGNHGYFHKQQSGLTVEQNMTEISSCGKVVSQLVGVNMDLFAPPGGDFGKNTLNAAEKCGYRTIMWSRDTIDWRDKDSAVVYERATKNTSGGELILIHPTQHTLQALEKIVQYYQNRGLKIVTVGQMLADA